MQKDGQFFQQGKVFKKSICLFMEEHRIDPL